MEPDNSARSASTPSEAWKQRIEKNLIWFALGLLTAGAIGAISFLAFLSSQIRQQLQTPEVRALIREQLPVNLAVPKGALVLFAQACPAGWEDFTPLLDQRYVMFDQTVTDSVKQYEGDGSHTHTGGLHSHVVVGKTAALGGGERSGNRDRHAAHMTNVVDLQEQPDQRSPGTHTVAETMNINARACVCAKCDA